MKNSNNYPGFDVPINIGIAHTLQCALIESVRNIILNIPQGELNETTENRLADGIAIIDHIKELLEKNSNYYEFMRQEIEKFKKQTIK